MMFSSHYCSTYLSISYWFAAAIVGLILVQSADSNCRVLSVDEICYPQPLHVSFYLYTRNTSNRPFQLNYNNIEEAPFLPSTSVKVLIHGYTGWKDYSPNMELRPAYFKRSDYNLISIDWSELAREGCYIEATNNVKPVGQCAARMLEKIVEVRKDVKPEDVHVVGFSLGAHVAGFIGKSLEKFRAKRITGLDPALPLFDNIFNSYYSLKEEDAEFIDVIHTNAGMKGKPSRVGHVDFFANDGSIQPGCAKTNTSCHHVRSVEIFAESINTQVGFFGFECASFFDYMTECCTNLETKPIGWVLLGEYVNRSSRGEYYFNTKSKSPFAIGKGCTP